MKLARFAVYAVAGVLTASAGCSNRDDRVPPAARTDESRPPVKPAEPAKPATATTAGPARDTVPADFPPDCVAYAELIEKLKQCDRLGNARAGLSRAYFDLRAAWSTVPAERRTELAQQCKVQADSLRSAAAATCGW